MLKDYPSVSLWWQEKKSFTTRQLRAHSVDIHRLQHYYRRKKRAAGFKELWTTSYTHHAVLILNCRQHEIEIQVKHFKTASCTVVVSAWHLKTLGQCKLACVYLLFEIRYYFIRAAYATCVGLLLPCRMASLCVCATSVICKVTISCGAESTLTFWNVLKKNAPTYVCVWYVNEESSILQYLLCGSFLCIYVTQLLRVCSPFRSYLWSLPLDPGLHLQLSHGEVKVHEQPARRAHFAALRRYAPAQNFRQPAAGLRAH